METEQAELPLFPQEEWYEQLLRYGLYLGAAFQIICILAVIFDVSPQQSDLGGRNSNSAGESSSDDDSEDEDHSNQQRNRRRIERKKRR